VATQIDRGARLWLQLADHRRFGRLLIGGPGDHPSSQPSFALTVPIAANAVRAALLRAGIDAPDRTLAALAAAIARFGWMAHDLGDRISRAEIHPLVGTADQDRALALDALIGIAS
jgi:hypothetical protein